jgi:hypothetical protein
MVRRITAALSVVVLCLILVGVAWGGAVTSNGFIYKPSLGAKGQTELNLYNAGQDRVDTRLGKEVFIGDPLYGTTIQSALTAIGSTPCTLRIPTGTTCNFPITTAILSNVNLRVDKGGLISTSPGATLTINGTIEAGPYQIFSGTGVIVLGDPASGNVYANWWGIVGDNATNNYTAVQASLAAISHAGTIRIAPDRDSPAPSYYKFGTKLTVNKQTNLIWEPGVALIFTTPADGNAIEITAGADGTVLTSPWIYTTTTDTSTGAAIYIEGINSYKILDPVIGSATGQFKYGIEVYKKFYGYIRPKEIYCSLSIAGSCGIYLHGDNVTGARNYQGEISGPGTIWNFPATGAGVKLGQWTHGWDIHTLSIEAHAGYAVICDGAGNWIHNNFFDGGTPAGGAYFDTNSRSNVYENNLGRNAGDRKFIDLGTDNQIREAYLPPTLPSYHVGAEYTRTTNWLKNGHFETQNSVGAVGTIDITKGFAPLHWTAFGTNSTVSYGLDTTEKTEGTRSFKIVNTNQASPRIYQRVELPHTGIWTLSGKVKSTLSGVAQIRVGTTAYGSEIANYANTDLVNWQSVSMSFNAAVTTIYVTCFYNSSAAGTAYWDGLCLVPGSTPERWKPHAEDSRPVWVNGITDSHTGDTNETLLKTVVIPAKLLGAKGVLRVSLVGATVGTAGNKTLRVKLGTDTPSTLTIDGAKNWSGQGTISNTAVGAQRSSFTGIKGDAPPVYCSAAGDIYTAGTTDTNAADVSLTITAQLADGGDTLSCHLLTVEAIPSP